MKAIKERLEKLDEFNLKKGNHANVEDGVCAMELVAYLANEPHSDRPQCASPSLTTYVIQLNDSFSDSERQLLKPYLPRLIGTRDDKELERANILAYAALTVFAPIALEPIGLSKHAEKLRALPMPKTQDDWISARNVAQNAANAAATAANVAYAANDSAANAADAANASAYAAYAADAAAADAAADADAAAYAAANAAYAAAAAVRKSVVEAALQALDRAINV